MIEPLECQYDDSTRQKMQGVSYQEYCKEELLVQRTGCVLTTDFKT